MESSASSDRCSRSLNSPVLVLNRSWTAIGTSTVRRSLVAMFRGVAAGLCVKTFALYDCNAWVDDNNPPTVSGTIRTPAGFVPAPEVVVMLSYDRLHATQPSVDSRGIYIRDGYRCQYCIRRLPPSELTIDHVLPRSRGGPTPWENCVTACVPCNQKKADRTPKEAGLLLAARPVRLRWDPVMRVSPSVRPESWKQLLGRAG